MSDELFDERPVHELPLDDPRRQAVARGFREFRKLGELLRRQQQKEQSHGPTQTQRNRAA